MSAGLGVLIRALGGNEATVDALTQAKGLVIKGLKIEDEKLVIDFVGLKIAIWDGGQSCCESRYMKTDDDLQFYVGAVFEHAEEKEAPNAPAVEDDYGGDHEIQFLEITTSKGVFQIANHNEHNGYYGGFYMEAAIL